MRESAAPISHDRSADVRAAGGIPGPLRQAMVYCLVAVIVGGALIAIVKDFPFSREPWPFSAYPMYSQPQRLDKQLDRHRLFGVVRDEAREIPLLESQYLYPFEHSRFYFRLSELEHLRDGGRALDVAMRDVLSRYEARRRAGLHDGPPLRAIRLYALRWKLDIRARNRDAPERGLLHEVWE